MVGRPEKLSGDQNEVADGNWVPPDLLQCLTAGSMIPGAAESWITLNEGVYNPAGAGMFSGASALTYALRSTEELRQVIVHCRALFEELVNEPAQPFANTRP